MIDADTLFALERIATALERIATALERIATAYAPRGEKRERQPAVLVTALYDRDERERKDLRERFSGTKAKPAPGTAATNGSR